MNSMLLLKIARWALRVFLFILGIGTLMTGWGLSKHPDYAEMGFLLMAAGIFLPGAEGIFYLLGKVEKRLQ